MTIQLLSICALIAAIAIGFFRKVNTGLMGIAFAFLIGHFLAGMSAKDIMNGFPLQLFLRLVGVSLMFFMAKTNGTMDLIATLIERISRGKNRLVPIFFFFANAILTALGPGPLPANSIMIPMAMAVAKREHIPDLLMGTVTASGALFGTLFPLSSTGIVASTLAADVGVTNYWPIFMGLTLASLLEGVILYFLLGGFRLENHPAGQREKIQMTREQAITIIVILLFVLCVLVLKIELFLAAFTAAALLTVLGVVQQNEAFRAVPWGTFIMICGINMLITVIDFVGGIDMLSNALSSVMTSLTAAPVMALIGGLLSLISSAVGVVMPTLIPTTAEIAAQVGGVSVSALISAIIVGSHLSAYSPMSGMGGLIMANANEETNKSQLFTQQIIISVLSTVFAGLLGFVGLYR
ncbi:MAG: hypothetical protein HFF39_03575 [Lawsonibacter sp.]|nr:hypothetical protein [Lawsonibacter sp.]